MINIDQNNINDTIKQLCTKVDRTADLYINSKDIKVGDVFIACISHNNENCLIYIKESLDLGAKAIIYDHLLDNIISNEIKSKYAHLLISVKNLSNNLSILASIWYNYPSRKLKVIAVTGTNGKTSCVNWIAHSLNHNGILCGVIGTLGYMFPDGQSFELKNTTPDVVSLNRILSKMFLAKAKYVAIEASSIGIDQERLANIEISIACFTNLTRDHLDYHKSISHYKKSKLKLFTYEHIEHVVLNIDDDFSKDIMLYLNKEIHIIKYGINKKSKSDLLAYNIHYNSNNTVFDISNNIDTHQIVTNLLGLHNIYNLLLVASVLNIIGLEISSIAKSIQIVNYIEGRLQKVELDFKLKQALTEDIPLVIVDYAHTPDALSTSIKSLKPLMQKRKGKIYCVFGCGGSRDQGKRHLMFNVALSLANKVVITSDNPRYESAHSIIEDIISDYHNKNDNVSIIVDRSEAIMSAIWDSNKEDIILIAGKGHEKYQEISGKRYFFDDYQWAVISLILYNSNINFSIDSRTIQSNNLFVAIKGKNFDGHEFLKQAENNSACAAIVNHINKKISLPQIILGNDTKYVLQHISKIWRKRFNIPIILVVGSNGKTTTTQMIASIFSQWYGVNNYLSTIGNFNNDIGVPLSLLRMRKNHLAAVIEIGMNHLNEIKPLSDLCIPDIVIITNAQREHQEFLKSIDNVIKENGSAIYSLSESGTVILPGDDNYFDFWKSMVGCKKLIRFGLCEKIEIYAQNIKIINNKTECDLFYKNNSPIKLILNIPGIHNVRNALAAISGCLTLNIPMDFIIKSIYKFQSIYGRLQFKYIKNIVLIDDTYNANPDSFEAAIDVLANLSGIKILICGDMGEIGINSNKIHFDIGVYAKKKNIDFVISVGKESDYISHGFGEPKILLKNIPEIMNFIQNIDFANILVKGSRFMNMEKIVDNIYTDLIRNK